MTGSGKRPRNPIGRAFEILSWLAAGEGRAAGPREIARGVAMTSSTVHRLLTQLEEERLVHRVADGRYELGLDFLRVAWQVSSVRSLREIAAPFLRDLAESAGETAILARYDPGRREACVVAAVESSEPIRFVSDMFERRSLHAGATGRAILAFLPEGERSEIMAGSLSAMTPRTITDSGELGTALETTRGRGYALSVEERRVGGVGLAAPVFAPGHSVIAAVGVALPVQRFEPEDEVRLAALVQGCAAAITAALGGS
jgi:IclR family acetate operon transcriptional repressor